MLAAMDTFQWLIILAIAIIIVLLIVGRRPWR